MKIDVKTIRELAENIEKYNLNEVTLESEGIKLMIKKETCVTKGEPVQVQQQLGQQCMPTNEPEKISEENREREYIIAPMVGTFYKSSATGNPAFVDSGMNVSIGET